MAAITSSQLGIERFEYQSVGADDSAGLSDDDA